jgi:6,7-dimethyl-8-ribityllumazine synthase
VIAPLVQGAIETMLKSGVKKDNIVIETVPGSYELPLACSRYDNQFFIPWKLFRLIRATGRFQNWS